MRLLLSDLRQLRRGLHAVWMDFRFTRIGLPTATNVAHWRQYWEAR